MATERLPTIAIRTANTGANGKGLLTDLAHTVDAAGPEAVAYGVHMHEGCRESGGASLTQENDSGTTASDSGQQYIVRRLTPLEAERLQGFPDNHTNLVGADPDEILARMPQYAAADEKDRKAIERKVRRWCGETPDGPRYKAIGNSMAVPVIRWIGERIAKVDALSHEEGL